MKHKSHISVTPIQATDSLNVDTCDSPFGPLLLASNEGGLVEVFLNADGKAEARLRKLCYEAEFNYRSDAHHAAARSYFNLPAAPQKLSLHLKGTPFQLAVWRALLDIPFGQTTTYKNIAATIGKPKAVRAVGTAIGRNPIFFIIPCHRVLAHNGTMGGYFWGLDTKRRILDWEAARA